MEERRPRIWCHEAESDPDCQEANQSNCLWLRDGNSLRAGYEAIIGNNSIYQMIFWNFNVPHRGYTARAQCCRHCTLWTSERGVFGPVYCTSGALYAEKPGALPVTPLLHPQTRRLAVAGKGLIDSDHVPVPFGTLNLIKGTWGVATSPLSLGIYHVKVCSVQTILFGGWLSGWHILSL